jgi:RTX calcium-binding nonapeptide repeat (4 copies)
MRRLVLVGLVAAVGLAGCGGGDSDGVTGGAGDDKISGTSGADVLDGKAGEDVIEAQAGDDEITGGDDADFLYGGPGDDRFLASEDDAVDVHDCGEGKDFVAEPDARDQLLPDCEEAAWTAKPPGEPYDNRIDVAPTVRDRSVEFGASCPDGCVGVLELRTPTDRKLLGKGRFDLAPGKAGAIRARLTSRGRELFSRSGYFRIVLRVAGVNSGFTTFLGR